MEIYVNFWGLPSVTRDYVYITDCGCLSKFSHMIFTYENDANRGTLLLLVISYARNFRLQETHDYEITQYSGRA